ncbi:hypothetical protein ACTXT7_008569 [Hymenolepis weldensis]
MYIQRHRLTSLIQFDRNFGCQAKVHEIESLRCMSSERNDQRQWLNLSVKYNAKLPLIKSRRNENYLQSTPKTSSRTENLASFDSKKKLASSFRPLLSNCSEWSYFEHPGLGSSLVFQTEVIFFEITCRKPPSAGLFIHNIICISVFECFAVFPFLDEI